MTQNDSDGSSTQRNIEPDLLTRTSWIDARTAYKQIRSGRAHGNVASLWVRQHLQDSLFRLGCTIQRHPGKVLFVGLLVLGILSVGLRSVGLEYKLDRLWTEDGGRVREELNYLEDKLEISTECNEQVVIQTTLTGENLLHHESLLAHVEILRKALMVEVELFDYKWGLADICVKPTAPSFGPHFVDKMFENIMPCEIVSPLNCFWEGSKLMNPWFSMTSDTLGLENVSWPNLNPVNLSRVMKTRINDADFPFQRMERFMSRAGITTAFQEKPCLDPYDEQCPEIAPNKRTRTLPDIGKTLTGGCYGFARKYSRWSEDLTIGGIRRNASGDVIGAAALRTIVHIMDNKEMFDFHRDTHYSHDIGWSIDKAREVIEAWQEMFHTEIKQLSSTLSNAKSYRFYTFTFNALTNILHKFTFPNIERLSMAATVILVFECLNIVLIKRSGGLWRIYVGVAAAVLHGLGISAGFGLCGVLQLTFNAMTTRVLPLLSLGLGGNSLFVLTYTMNRIRSSGVVPVDRQIGECLKQAGMVIFITDISLLLAFAAASIIPISALRHLSLQGAIVHVCSSTGIFVLFPAACSVELYRRNLSPVSEQRFCGQTVLPPSEAAAATAAAAQTEQREWSLINIAKKYHIVMFHPVVRCLVLLSAVLLVAFGFWGMIRMKDGISLMDVVPAKTEVHEYLRYHERYFGTYRVFAITQADFDYPANQSLLYEFYDALLDVDQIEKRVESSGFWLSHFREWLIELQNQFDIEWANGYITAGGWTSNASLDGILAYKLLVQTGLADTPVDEQLLPWNRLVDGKGLINPKPFYNYLTAWYNHDALGYTLSRASLIPQPRQWRDTRTTTKDMKDLTIAKSPTIEFAQIPFFLHELCSTPEVTEAIGRIRSISEKFERRGLPNFPSGLPFIYWDQYLHLRSYLVLAAASILTAIAILTLSILLNIWTVLLIVLLLTSCLIQAFGVLYAMNIPLNAVPAVIIVVTIGVGVEHVVYLSVGFLTALGATREHRVLMTLDYMTVPLMSSTLNRLLGAAVFSFAEFDFVVTHFSRFLAAIQVIYAYNSFVVLPVLLSVFGPPCELIPYNNPSQIDPPSESTDSSPELELRSFHSSTQCPQHHPSADSGYQIHPGRTQASTRSGWIPRHRHSLSTISEERTSCRTTSPASALTPTGLVLLPEITVETTLVRNALNGHVTNSSSESTDGEMHKLILPKHRIVSGPRDKDITTTVTTTAKVKVTMPHRGRGTVVSQ